MQLRGRRPVDSSLWLPVSEHKFGSTGSSPTAEPSPTPAAKAERLVHDSEVPLLRPGGKRSQFIQDSLGKNKKVEDLASRFKAEFRLFEPLPNTAGKGNKKGTQKKKKPSMLKVRSHKAKKRRAGWEREDLPVCLVSTDSPYSAGPTVFGRRYRQRRPPWPAENPPEKKQLNTLVQ